MVKNKLELIEPIKVTWQTIKRLFVVITAIGVVAGVIADWSGLWGEITKYFHVILSIISIILLIIIVWQYFAYKKNLERMKEMTKGTQGLPKSIKRKCRVLIVDDKDTDLKEIETKLGSGISQKKIHDVYINSIPDYQLAEAFDVIISDIYGAGSGSKESIGALKALRDAYPYKIVAAMSSITNKDTKNKLGDPFIPFLSKRKKNEIKDFVENSIERLDNLEAFILSVEASLKEKGLNDEEIKTKREEYLDYLERMKRLAGN